MPSLGNTPEARVALLAVSRGRFPVDLVLRRFAQLCDEVAKLGVNVDPCETILKTDADVGAALAEVEEKGADAAALYLGNFGPEGPTTVFAQRFGGPVMLCGAAEERGDDLVGGRGDAYCGMLSACYNAALRNVRVFLPPAPIGLPADVAKMIAHFALVARVAVGVQNLKIITFGPRPQDFFTCHAPLMPLYDMGVEVMENSELDLLQLFEAAAAKKNETAAIVSDMERELGDGNRYPAKLPQVARLELALMTFAEDNLGSRDYVVFANKCWPGFEPAFGFTPCYVNSRMASRGIPVACEVDVYGALSEYMAQLASGAPATLLDINNTVPDDIEIADLKGAARGDLFMGFHCGNTPSCHLCEGFAMKYQLIMHRLMEPDSEPNISCGTLEGTLRPGPLTLFRVQGAIDCTLGAYAAEGHVLAADPATFGGTGIVGIPDFARFYRHALLAKQFPHHTAVAFTHAGRVLFDAARLLGVDAVDTPLPAGRLYPDENPFDALGQEKR